MKKSSSLSDGLTLVEVLVATAIILAFLTTLVSVHNIYLRSLTANVDLVKATYLAEEGIEVVKGLRDKSWSSNIASLTNGTPYYLNFSTSTSVWSTTTVVSTIDNRFYRTATLSAVNRDSSSDITTSGGTLDLNIRKVNVTVSWNDTGATTTRSIDTYITNLFAN